MLSKQIINYLNVAAISVILYISVAPAFGGECKAS